MIILYLKFMRFNFRWVNKNLIILINKLFCLENEHFQFFGYNKFWKKFCLCCFLDTLKNASPCRWLAVPNNHKYGKLITVCKNAIKTKIMMKNTLRKLGKMTSLSHLDIEYEMKINLLKTHIHNELNRIFLSFICNIERTFLYSNYRTIKYLIWNIEQNYIYFEI